VVEDALLPLGRQEADDCSIERVEFRVHEESFPDAGENNEFDGRRCAAAADGGGGARACLFGYKGGFSGEKNDAALL
jgi:hypothetical protein